MKQHKPTMTTDVCIRCMHPAYEHLGNFGECKHLTVKIDANREFDVDYPCPCRRFVTGEENEN